MNRGGSALAGIRNSRAVIAGKAAKTMSAGNWQLKWSSSLLTPARWLREPRNLLLSGLRSSRQIVKNYRGTMLLELAESRGRKYRWFCIDKGFQNNSCAFGSREFHSLPPASAFVIFGRI